MLFKLICKDTVPSVRLIRDSKSYNHKVRKNAVYESSQSMLMQSNIHFILEACKLFCRKGSLLYPKGLVKDGTKCLHGSKEGNDLCIGGKCMV